MNKNILMSLILSGALFSGAAIACPVLDGVDLADGDEKNPVFEEVGDQNATLTRAEFLSIPSFQNSSADGRTSCRKDLTLRKLKIKKTGEIFYALLTMRDECDGGNSFGALMSGDLQTVVADIGDSFISCLDETVDLDLSRFQD
jgi:hypothetical protein